MPDDIARWLNDHANPLSTLTPGAPVEDTHKRVRLDLPVGVAADELRILDAELPAAIAILPRLTGKRNHAVDGLVVAVDLGPGPRRFSGRSAADP
ncbi:hypothetical protein ABT224_14905 [Streptomyces sp. NPDC001584]|uniref:hypothetical protein n=1 Tax=Streptomyces sp. NPDC001584 TaxID=3154521 RepID=UPI00331BE19B